MGTFIGGSAYAMSRDIAEGYILLSPNYLKKFTSYEMMALQSELEKLQRETRAEQPPLDDIDAIKKRNRRIQRVSAALMTIKNVLQSRR
ncbi:MAG: hypothetical protein AB1756_10720 [Acidobacteriota bacterium]